MIGITMRSSNSSISESGAPPLSVYKFLAQFGLGGTEMQVLGLARQFNSTQYALSFGCLRAGGTIARDYGAHGWNVAEYPIRRFASIRAGRELLRLARELKVRSPKVLHSYNFYANVFSIPAARMAGVPCVIASIRDMGVYLTPNQLRVQRMVCQMADRIIVNAEAIRDWLIAGGYTAEKILVVRNGVDIPVLENRSIRTRIRDELGIPSNAKVVMMVSRLNPQKGVEYLIEAVPEILKEIPEAWFVIVGDVVMESAEEERKYCEGIVAKARELGVSERVVFTGLRRDVPHLLAAADLSVLPSLSEGLPNAVIEAMAAGLPVVASRVGGIPELIHQGHTGLLVPPGDIAALAKSMIALLANPFLRRRIGESARRHIQSEFSFQKMYQETIAIYHGVLEEKNHALQRWMRAK